MKSAKMKLVEISIIIVSILILYITGLHTEVIGFVQRGILATGIMNPKIEQVEKNNHPKANLNFNLTHESGEIIQMRDYRGKVIFINLWATWCPPCIAEMPTIQQFYESAQDKNVAIFMISLDDDVQKAINFRDKKGYDFDIYHLENGLPEMYRSSSIPTTFMISKEGRLVMTHQGMADYSTDDFLNYVWELQE